MDNYSQVLVFILSTVLAINLILVFAVLLKVREILGDIKNITAKAEKVADNVEHVSSFFEKTAAPVAIGKMLANIVNSLSKRK